MDILVRIVAFVRRNIVMLAFTLAGYVALSLVDFFFSRSVGMPETVISPAGLSMAAMILGGYAVWPAIALGALLHGVIDGAPPVVVAGFVLGSVVQPAVGLYALRRLRFDPMFFDLRDMFALVGVSLACSMITSVFTMFAATLAGVPEPFDVTDQWLANALSMLVLTPFLVRWIRRPLAPRADYQYIEITIALAAVVVSSFLAFATTDSSFYGFDVLYLAIAAIFWLAFRAGVRFTTLAILLLTAISLLGSVYGTHAAEEPLILRVVSVQLFDLTVAFFFFVLVSLEEQRQIALRGLQNHAQQLESALGRISVEDEAKNEFIALLGHELRNPLASLLSSIEVFTITEPPPVERAEILSAMKDRVRAMTHLLEDILDISRITRRKFMLRKEPVSLARVLRRAQSTVEPVMRSRHHVFQIVSTEPAVTIDGDPTRLEQIVVNILNNAAAYTPEGGKVECKASYEDGTATIEVRDTGIGIPAEMRERIFEPFVQVNGKGNRGGMGLGLSLTKSLVELHGGTISVSSEPGRGSTFTVHIPAYRDDRRMIPFPQMTQRKPPASLCILVVDDNEEAARVLGKLLTHRGHNVSLLFKGAHVMSTVESQKPDIVFLDIGLPDIDGFEIARAMRKKGILTTLVALSGYGQEEDKRKSREAGFDYHLTKPASLADIEQTIGLAALRAAANAL